jgi:hypothetical protein
MASVVATALRRGVCALACHNRDTSECPEQSADGIRDDVEHVRRAMGRERLMQLIGDSEQRRAGDRDDHLLRLAGSARECGAHAAPAQRPTAKTIPCTNLSAFHQPRSEGSWSPGIADSRVIPAAQSNAGAQANPAFQPILFTGLSYM